MKRPLLATLRAAFGLLGLFAIGRQLTIQLTPPDCRVGFDQDRKYTGAHS